MRLVGMFAILVASGFAAAPVLAADPITYATSASNAEMPVGTAGFDWNGFYAGVYGAAKFTPSQGAQYGAGLDLGLNAQYDFYLLGAEVAAYGIAANDDADSSSYGQILARGGILVGSDLALYGAAGYGLDLGASDDSQWLLGGGLEMAVTDNVSVRAQYLHGFSNTGTEPTDEVTFGANYHF